MSCLGPCGVVLFGGVVDEPFVGGGDEGVAHLAGVPSAVCVAVVGEGVWVVVAAGWLGHTVLFFLSRLFWVAFFSQAGW